MVDEMARAGFSVDDLRQEYQNRTRQAEANLVGTLAGYPALQEGLGRLCTQIRLAAQTRWLQYCGVL